MNESILEVKDVWKTYPMGDFTVEALRGVDLVVNEGEYLALVGPSGSGKSSLLHMLGFMDTPTKGEVLFDEKPSSGLKDKEKTQLRLKNIGFVFQTFNLLPNLSALENVEIVMRVGGVPKDKRRKKAAELLEKVGLADRVRHLPNQLSGGQRQRVAIARALANNPKLILADEPTGNLDSATGEEVINLFKQLNEEGQTIIIVTHNEDIARQAQKRLTIKDGRIEL